MRAYWVNFARTGDPNGPNLTEWPAFTAATERVMQFDTIASVRPTPNIAQLKALGATTPGASQAGKQRLMKQWRIK